MADSEDVMFREAVTAISQGQRSRARDLLTRLLKADQNNPNYWLWMSAVVDSNTESIYCLESALRLDPSNRPAQRGLVLLGARPPEAGIQPVFPTQRRWKATLIEDEAEPPLRGWKALWQNNLIRLAVLGLLGLILIGAAGFGINSFVQGRKQAAALSQITPIFRMVTLSSNTPTLLPTGTLVVRSPTPTFIGAVPLWKQLEATYTPSPVFVNTPHMISEAYRSGMRAFENGNYANMLAYMQQASKVDPGAADVHYYIGEAYRLMGNYEEALAAYSQAILVNPSFAPGYLGRGLVQPVVFPGSDPSEDFVKAIELDPYLPQTYLERARYLLEQNDPQAALEDLALAETMIPESATLFVYRSEALLQLGEVKEALEAAQRAYDLDLTLLPAYKALAMVYFAQGKLDKALHNAEIFLAYSKSDARGWVLKGRILGATGEDHAAAIQAFTQALALDETLQEARYYRSLEYIRTGEGQNAVNDLMDVLREDQRSFAYNLAFGQALLVAERTQQALQQFEICAELAETDRELGEVYYWQALANEKQKATTASITAWEALLALPEEAVPDEWIKTAQGHLSSLYTPTPTSTPTVTKTPTATRTPKPTSTAKNPLNP